MALPQRTPDMSPFTRAVIELGKDIRKLTKLLVTLNDNIVELARLVKEKKEKASDQPS